MIPGPATERSILRCAYPNKKEALARCDLEITAAQKALKESTDGKLIEIWLWLQDWRNEKRLIEAETE
jgi:hypothetical protein